MSSARADQSVLFTTVSSGPRIAPAPKGLSQVADASKQEPENRPRFGSYAEPQAQCILLPQGVQGVQREATFELDLEGQNEFFSKSRTQGSSFQGVGMWQELGSGAGFGRVNTDCMRVTGATYLEKRVLQNI